MLEHEARSESETVEIWQETPDPPILEFTEIPKSESITFDFDAFRSPSVPIREESMSPSPLFLDESGPQSPGVQIREESVTQPPLFLTRQQAKERHPEIWKVRKLILSKPR